MNQQHPDAVAAEALARIPVGAPMAYVDASVKDGIAAIGIVYVRAHPDPDLGMTTMGAHIPDMSNANAAECVAVASALELGAAYVVTDSQAAINLLADECEAVLLFVPGDADVPFHRQAHELAAEARERAEEDQHG